MFVTQTLSGIFMIPHEKYPAIGSEATLLCWKHHPCAHLMGKTSRTKFVIVKLYFCGK
jgi:hypothetical protein